MFLKNRNIISNIRRSKVTDYAALIHKWPNMIVPEKSRISLYSTDSVHVYFII